MTSSSFHQQISEGSCYVIAEAGVNHNGDMDVACRMIDAAAKAGADAVKFQSFFPRFLVSEEAPKAEYQMARTSASESQLEMLERLALTEKDHRTLIAHCELTGIQFLTTPFERESLKLLQQFDLPAYKIPSGEITNLPFLAEVASCGKPIILSTGMSSMEEVSEAVDTIKGSGVVELSLLHCVSNYPTRVEDVNLMAMLAMRERFSLPVGFSDHTMGIEVPIAATALGASIIEKHFTLDRTLPGPDQSVSLEPQELREMVRCIRNVEAALGNGGKRRAPSEEEVANVARKSLFLTMDLKAGAVLTDEHLVAKRPGDGISPSRTSKLLGKRLRTDLGRETKLSWEMLE